jgi:BirA family biotin operon repressor/biotin-[acetyl-CoA-carboxylase] ligase
MDLDIERVKRLRAGGRLGCVVEWHASIGSTNDRALHLAAEGAVEGLVVVADSQSAGRGRRERTWHDRPGGALLCSVLLRPSLPQRVAPLLSLAAAAAAAFAIRETSGVAAGTKWPNDVVVRDAASGRPGKLGGILLEMHGGALVVGIGINVGAAPELDGAAIPAVCLEQLAGRPLEREPLLAALLQHLELLYAQLESGDADGVLDAFGQLDTARGMAVTLGTGADTVSGDIEGCDIDGALLLRTPTGTRRYLAGEVTLSG